MSSIKKKIEASIVASFAGVGAGGIAFACATPVGWAACVGVAVFGFSRIGYKIMKEVYKSTRETRQVVTKFHRTMDFTFFSGGLEIAAGSSLFAYNTYNYIIYETTPSPITAMATVGLFSLGVSKALASKKFNAENTRSISKKNTEKSHKYSFSSSRI